MPLDLAVLVLTHNEERHIERCLRSVAGIAREVVVVDSYSTDRTVEIAKRLGASVMQHEFINYAKQFQWGLANAGFSTSWVMRLDADEIIEADLADEMATRLPALPPDIVGVNLKRKHIFMGRWIRHGGRYPLILLRVWRRGKARIEQRWMDEHMLITEGRVVTFSGGFSDVNINDLSYFTRKHERYATREALDVINQRRRLFERDEALAAENTSWATKTTRHLKERIYNILPFELASTSYFLMRYIVQLGFLDGREGAIYHFLQGFWYRFLVGARVLELERSLGDLQGEAALAKLSELTGLKISTS